MKRTILIIALVAVLAAAATGWYFYNEANKDFTPWMSVPELTTFLKQFQPINPDQPDYWKRGHWITAAEGRWHDGMEQFRIRYTDAPKDREFEWYWFIDQDQITFSSKIKEYGDKGFVLVYNNSYTRPDGTTRFQGVWHKMGNPGK